jgi:hypothetical protein
VCCSLARNERFAAHKGSSGSGEESLEPTGCSTFLQVAGGMRGQEQESFERCLVACMLVLLPDGILPQDVMASSRRDPEKFLAIV